MRIVATTKAFASGSSIPSPAVVTRSPSTCGDGVQPSFTVFSRDASMGNSLAPVRRSVATTCSFRGNDAGPPVNASMLRWASGFSNASYSVSIWSLK